MIFRDIPFSERCLIVFVKIWNLKSVFIAVNETKALYLHPVWCAFHVLSLMCNDTLVCSSYKSISRYFNIQNPSSRYNWYSAGYNQGAVLLRPAEPNSFTTCLWLANGPGLGLLTANMQSMMRVLLSIPNCDCNVSFMHSANKIHFYNRSHKSLNVTDRFVLKYLKHANSFFILECLHNLHSR